MSATALTDTQHRILTTACERQGGLVLPLSVPLKGGAVRMTLTGLLKRGLVEEVPAKPEQEVWCTTDDGTAATPGDAVRL